MLAASDLTRLVLCFAVAVIALALTSCDPCRRCVTPAGVNVTTYVHDTTTVTVHVRDTVETVRLLPGQASATAPEADTARAETAYAAAVAYLRGRNIVLEIRNKDTAAALVRQIETLTERLREVLQNAENTVVKRERYVPRVVECLAWLGGMALAVMLFSAIFAVLRRRF